MITAERAREQTSESDILTNLRDRAERDIRWACQKGSNSTEIVLLSKAEERCGRELAARLEANGFKAELVTGWWGKFVSFSVFSHVKVSW